MRPGAGAEADLRPRSPPTSSATTSCSTITCSAAWSAIASAAGRLRIGWGRLAESEDDELAYAYFAANEPQTRSTTASAACGPMPGAPIRSTAVPRAARHGHGAEGDRPRAAGWLNGLLTRVGLWFLRRQRRQVRGAGGLSEAGVEPSRASLPHQIARIPSAPLRRPGASTARSFEQLARRPPSARRRIPGRARRGRCRSRGR